jgi:ligand-binding sensor domain-containing protein
MGSTEALIQDNRGFMWFGGQDGLLRYDGYNLRSYRHEASNLHSIWSITEDGQGKTWLATEGGLYRFDPVYERFHHYLDDPGGQSLSQNDFREVLWSKDGKIWVGSFGGGLSLYRPESDDVAHIGNPDNQLTDKSIWTLFEDNNGLLWVGTDEGGLNTYNPTTGQFSAVELGSEQHNGRLFNRIRAVYQSRDGLMWIGSSNGLVSLDPSTGAKSYYFYDHTDPATLGGNVIWDIHEDGDGLLWIATDGAGVSVLNRDNSTFLRLKHHKQLPTSLQSNVIRKIISDNNGDLWFGHFPAGVSTFFRAAEDVQLISSGIWGEAGLNHDSVLSILEGEEQNTFWLGTDGGGVNFLNLTTRNFEYFTHQEDDSTSISGNAVLSSARDKFGRLWFGTWGASINRYDPATKSFIRYASIPSIENTPSHQNIWAMLLDSRGDLYIGTEGGGINRYDANTDSFIRLPYGENDPYSVKGRIVWHLFEDSEGKIWVGTNSGVEEFDPESGVFVQYSHSDKEGSLSDNSVQVIFEDSQNRLWVGTRGGLNLFDRENTGFRVFGINEGLASDNIASMQQAEDGEIWLGTAVGLSSFRYSPDAGMHDVRNFDHREWGRGKFAVGAAYKSKSKHLLFGGTSGLVRFDSSALKRRMDPPEIVITKFEIFNRTQNVVDNRSPLSRSIEHSNEITLNHEQSVFRFEYAALDYNAPNKNSYAYRLVGFDRDWREVGNERIATYTNLDAGNYVFEVKGSNSEGIWNENPARIQIKILPPPWLTWWAYSIYGLVVGGLLFWYISAQQLRIARERDRNEKLLNLVANQ